MGKAGVTTELTVRAAGRTAMPRAETQRAPEDGRACGGGGRKLEKAWLAAGRLEEEKRVSVDK